jgi:DNA transformation protein
MKRADDNTFIAHVADLMAPWAPVSARAMFGGYGIYRDNTMFALAADDTLYLKVDADTQARFIAAGSSPFVYTGKGKSITMSYWRAPETCLESPSEMRVWCAPAWDAALRARASKAKPEPGTQRRRSARTKS